VNVRFLRRTIDVIVGGDFSDPTNERLIYLSAAGLALVGLLLLIGTILWWRRGRQEHPVLAPLEVLGGRAWAKATEGDRRRRLDQVRLAGAGAAAPEPVFADPVDLRAVRAGPSAFDDLREPAEVEQPVGDELDGVAGEGEPVAEPSDTDEPVDVDAESPVAVVDSGLDADADATSVSAERPVDDVVEHDDDPSDEEIVSIEATPSEPIDPPL
jgi:hypothetical protein